MPKTMSALIALSILTIAGVASASSTVEQGGRIQAVLDSASPGETIEVESGTYRESLVIDKPLVLKGVDSGGGAPIVETDTGSAITLRADGIVLENISARSTSSWTGDAGILVLSNSCVIRGCMASGNGNIGIMLLEATDCRLSGDVAEGNSREGIYLKNSSSNLLEGNLLKGNRYGLKLSASNENWILYNNISENRYEGIYLQESHRNTIKGNRAEGNDGALVMEGCRDNIVARNDFLGNDKGISLSDFRSSGSRPEGEGVLISYSIMPSEDLVSSNNTIYLNNLSNRVNARDDSLNAWDDGRIGNNYSDFNEPSEGCTGKRICDSEHSIPGGPSVDRYPQAVPLRIPGRLSGPGGAVLQLFQSSFLPGSEIVLNFTAPASYEVWAGIRPGDAGSDLYLGRNVTGDLAFSAPELEGSYTLVMHDMNGTQVMAIPFNVTIPTISAAPGSLLTCERIYVAFRGAPGQKDSWIGMYRA
ncbi:MAG: right-handed parallel beta-helix repeat-containing protein, partial [Methanothrix sp.]|nr:right-handed parallel beta-helix repeat-containing protein [Methanothrix sp.]